MTTYARFENPKKEITNPPVGLRIPCSYAEGGPSERGRSSDKALTSAQMRIGLFLDHRVHISHVTEWIFRKEVP